MSNKQSHIQWRSLQLIKQRTSDLALLKAIIQSGRALSYKDGDRFMSIIHLYPLEIGYFCYELNPTFLHFIGEIIQFHAKKIEETLN